jgi:hypothetical protein
MKNKKIEPLEKIPRDKLQLMIMQNIETAIKDLPKRNQFRWWWEHTVNWVKVQRFINNSTNKAGSTSSGQQCIFIGIHPDKYSVFDLMEKEQDR